jgi:WD40 repeat protein
MLRQRVKAGESDRFITARSVERDKKIEKYNIRDDLLNDCESIKEGLNLNESFNIERKVRTPTIVTDEKQYSKNLYLSLLKSQIFNSESKSERREQENLSGVMSKKKKKYTEYISKMSGEKNDKVNSSKNLNQILNFNDIAKKIDFSNYNLRKTENYYPNIRSFNKLSFENMPFGEDNTKYTYKNLINFEIEDTQCTKKFLNQKKIPKSPFKILDAPNLKDDFYLHLLNWSSKDFLAVGLEKNLYIWESKNSTVNLLSTLEEDYISAVNWSNDGEMLFIGTSSGKLNVWDIEKSKISTTYDYHSERVGVITTMNCNNHIFTSGSQDKMIFNYDLRIDPNQNPINKLFGHSQEVCGLKWSLNDRLLASGGNDNKLILWNGNKFNLEKKFKSHTSAVKALDWSPHKFGCLISGGGTQDRTIKIWNTNTMSLVESIDTSSQVCNIAFSKNSHEFVTTHGYSDNLILLWDSDTLDVKATLKGHKDRVIYLSTGPDLQKIVTGAGDETIRFWDVFTKDIDQFELNDQDGIYYNNKFIETRSNIVKKQINLR